MALVGAGALALLAALALGARAVRVTSRQE
jgi:NAD(P)H-hydrate repair Nnr-like enzyme with NAD(P)H-hydrate dehydratase domain